MRPLSRLSRLAPLVAVAAAGCFATRNDVKLLQAHLDYLQQTVETSRTEADRARLAQLQRDSSLAMAIRQLATLTGATRDSVRTLTDTVRVFMEAFSRFKADVALSDAQLAQTMYTALEMVGVSQKRIADLQLGFDTQRDQRQAAGGSDTSAKGGMPSPRQMYQMGMTQLQQSRPDQARGVFQDFIALYPDDPLISNAIYQLAETYARVGDDRTADSIFKSVTERFPKSDYAPTALYKRAEALLKAGQPKAAKTLYEQIVRDYTKSNEYAKAKDRLKTLPPE